MQPVEPRYSVQVLIDAAQILGAFGPQNKPLGIAEISRTVGIGRSKVHRLLDTLRFLGFVEHDEVTRRYRLGLRTFELAAAASNEFDLGPAARHALEQLAETTGETVNVGVLVPGGELLYVDSVRGFGPMRLEIVLGTRAPANCVAMGKAILAFVAPERLEVVLSRPLVALTRNSITDPERLRQELVRVREVGYALDDEESFPGIRCVAVPVMDYSGLPAAAVAISGPAARLSLSNLISYAQPLKETAARISGARLVNGAASRAENGQESVSNV